MLCCSNHAGSRRRSERRTTAATLHCRGTVAKMFWMFDTAFDPKTRYPIKLYRGVCSGPSRTVTSFFMLQTSGSGGSSLSLLVACSASEYAPKVGEKCISMNSSTQCNRKTHLFRLSLLFRRFVSRTKSFSPL